MDFTPAPWKREGSIIVGAEGTPSAQVICKLRIGSICGGEDVDLRTMHSGSVDGNARLIAAAPDMYAALQEGLILVEAMAHNKVDLYARHTWQRKAAAAVRTAKGE